jgi:[methyl-Co(III) methanol-specific corrinoid protein]:coenzyme M methyltransferase
MTTMNARERVLKLFAGEAVDRPPCFSGMGNVTTEGLKSLNQKFAATHLDAKMMAAAAATTYKLFGFESAVAPFDLCIEAEAMGCEINVYAHSEDLLYPTIKKKLIHNEAEMEISIPSDITRAAGSRSWWKRSKCSRRTSGPRPPWVPTSWGPSRSRGRSWS